MPKTVYIETFGCQMNVLDSELVASQLRHAGYRLTPDWRQADTILLNTCSVRQHAEDKVYSRLGRLRGRKRQYPDLVVGVIGCMAQKEGAAILQRMPHVDLVCGPGQLARIAELLETVRTWPDRPPPPVAVSLSRGQAPRDAVLASFDAYNPPRDAAVRPRPFQAFVRIMSGCDKVCTYCVVPRVRGPEQSRRPETILEEVRRLADQGVVEITLLGQTVNSYRYAGEDGRRWRLSDLLEQVSRIASIRRLKFITNFPRHMTRDLLEAVRDLPTVCPYLHVPAQSGSDRVLQGMKRGYTAEDYRRMVYDVRQVLPGAALSSDFIVGFPGETPADFQQTLDLLAEVRFKQVFVFKYSPRPGTAAYALADDVPGEEKKRRHQVLLDLQETISRQEHQRLVGSTFDVLVEGRSKLKGHPPGSDAPMMGRTVTDHIVVFPGPPEWVGRIVPVTITGASALVLFGRPAAP